MPVESSENLIPERVLQRALKIGVDAITADTDVLDLILGEHLEDAAELAKAKNEWAARPPRVVLGYPRGNTQMPCFAVTVTSDRIIQDMIGMGEEGWLDLSDDVQGTQYRRRITGVFTVYIYASHPELCAWWYRVARRIVNVASTPAGYFHQRNLEEVTVDGADLVPDPQYTPEDLFVRRLTVSMDYWETLTDQDALWTALNGAGYSAGSVTVDILHEDQPGGGVTPYVDEG